MKFKNVNILVIGDVMLDQYWFGATARISPEAPVPVVQVDRVHERPGGAANVALGIAALGAKPQLLGLVGQDEAALRLQTLLSQASVLHDLHPMPHHPTITKLRIMSRNQQMIRLDTEQPFSTLSNLEYRDKLREKYQSLLDTVDAVVLSDYGKGTLADIPWFIEKARERKLPIFIDPKSTDFSLYRGASIITPNMKEFEAVVGPCATEETLIHKAKALMKEQNFNTLVVTRSEQGMTVITHMGAVNHIPAVARDVHDVTGAGDTVMAVLATALASEFPLMEAANLSNLAAGIAVGKIGATPVTIAELEHALLKTETILPTGVMTEAALLAILKICKSKGEKIIFTNGCFDILHAGHVMYLEQAKRLGDRVIVAVNSDDSVRRLKGSHRPVNSLADRMSVLAGLKAVDWVVPFTEDTPERIIREISPHVLVKGGDYQEPQELPGAAYVLSQGGTVELLGLKEGFSTSHLIQNIVAQKENANVG